MPLKIELTVGNDTFKVEGDAMDPAIVDLAKAWVGALPAPDPDANTDQQDVDALTGQLRGQTDDLSTAVDGQSEDDDQPSGAAV